MYKRGVNWVLKMFLNKISKFKLYAQVMQMNKFFRCMLMIDNKYKESKDRESNTRICYRSSANCLRPRSKYDYLEILL